MPQKDQISNNEWFAQSNVDFESQTHVFNIQFRDLLVVAGEYVSKFEIIMIVKSFTALMNFAQ